MLAQAANKTSCGMKDLLETVTIQISEGGSTMCVAGVDDVHYKGPGSLIHHPSYT